MAKDLSKVLAKRRDYSEEAMKMYFPTAENKILDREMDAQFQMNTIVGEIVDIDMSRLRPYAKHPFKPHSEEKITALAESIKRDGLQQPIIVRSVNGVSGYEILAGHNRVAAVKRLGKRDISAIIRDADDDKAALVVVKTNLEQREKLLPSEKAFAYRLQMEALHQDETQIIKNDDFTSDTNGLRLGVQNEPRGKTREGLADAVGVSDSEIQRYIRLTHLIPGLLDVLDEEKCPVMAGYEVSFLDTPAQEAVCHYFFVENTADKLSVKNAETIRVAFQDGKVITSDSIFALLHKPKTKPGPKVYSIPHKRLKQFKLPENFNFEEYVLRYLEQDFGK